MFRDRDETFCSLPAHATDTTPPCYAKKPRDSLVHRFLRSPPDEEANKCIGEMVAQTVCVSQIESGSGVFLVEHSHVEAAFTETAHLLAYTGFYSTQLLGWLGTQDENFFLHLRFHLCSAKAPLIRRPPKNSDPESPRCSG